MLKLRAKNVEKRRNSFKTNDGLPEISKMNNRNRIQEPGTTISGFADSKNKSINANRPTLDFLTWHSKHLFFFFGLTIKTLGSVCQSETHQISFFLLWIITWTAWIIKVVYSEFIICINGEVLENVATHVTCKFLTLLSGDSEKIYWDKRRFFILTV